MQIIWSERAFERRLAIEDYIFYSFGFSAYESYVLEVEEWQRIVLSNPFSGQEEPLLAGMCKAYRSNTIGRLTKCIYYVEGENIVVVDWWDTRRSPQILTQGL